MMVSFCAVLFPRDVLDEILNLIESVSEGFPSYSCGIGSFPCTIKPSIEFLFLSVWDIYGSDGLVLYVSCEAKGSSTFGDWFDCCQ